MNKVVDFMRPRPSVKQILEIHRRSPRKSIDSSKKGIIFSNFEEWRQVAGRANNPSPHAKFWRRLALSYPDNLAARDFFLFFEEAVRESSLSEQARARLFNLSAKKLPAKDKLRALSENSVEQAALKKFLINKKILGDADFARQSLAQAVSLQEDGSVSFHVEGGKVERRCLLDFVHKEREVLSVILEHRFNTLLGPATMLPVEWMDDSYPRFYLLVDGQEAVKKLRLPEFNWLDLSSD